VACRDVPGEAARSLVEDMLPEADILLGRVVARSLGNLAAEVHAQEAGRSHKAAGRLAAVRKALRRVAVHSLEEGDHSLAAVGRSREVGGRRSQEGGLRGLGVAALHAAAEHHSHAAGHRKAAVRRNHRGREAGRSR